jgi:hypothetical protein
MLRRTSGVVLLALIAFTPRLPAADPTLEEGLLTQAGDVMRLCKARGYKTVAVLKFHIKKGDERLSHNVGTLNQSLARRLEIALVLQNDPRQPVGVVRDASAVAAKISGAGHLTADGRAKLFGAKYPLMWGTSTVTPDVFVTGVANVSDDLKTIKVSLVSFDRKSKAPEPVGAGFAAGVQVGQLGEMGESFSLRDAFEPEDTVLTTVPDDTPPVPPARPAELAAEVKHQKQTHPLRPKACPVGLEFRYNGKPVEIEFRDGKGFVPTPLPGQKVELVLARDSAPDTYGVVLKVNGENTIGRQTVPDVDCRKWVMPPGCKPYTIRGYQTGNSTAEEFKVATGRETAKLAVNYGADVGTVTLTVFQNLKGKPAPASDDDHDVKVAAVRSQTAPQKGSFELLYADLTGEVGQKGLIGAEEGGLVVPGGTVENQVKKSKFVPDPTPLAAVTVVYYVP